MSRLIIVSLLLVATGPQTFAQSGRVTGRIVDATTGEPAIGVRVTLTMAPVTPAGRATSPPAPLPPLSTETNANGAFDITGVPAGRWRVRAQKAGFIPYGLNTAPFEVSGGTVSVPEIRLDRGGVITGRLLDAKGNPMSGMTVRDMQLVRLPDGRERPGGGSASVQTNDLGEFRLAGLPPGQHYVIAEPRLFGPLGAAAPAPATVMYVPTFYPGFADAASASPITVTSGATTNGVEFSMLAPAAYQVSGIVVDADGRAVSGALVQLMQQPRSMTMFQLQGGPSARDGTFRITNVPSGTYLAVAAIPVVIRNGNSTSSSVTFGAAASRAGVEIAVQGANLGGVRVVVGQ